MSTSVRPIAPLPQASSQPVREPHKAPTYIPSGRQLEPGSKNPLILALRSSIPDEVDWALPRLIVASYDHPDRFLLEKYIDSLPALLEWPLIWLEDLERAAALNEARKQGYKGLALAAVPEWTVDPATETRAVNSLLVLRNASYVGINAKHITSKAFIGFITRFFALPYDFLLDIILRSPEPIQHILVTLQAVTPFLPPSPPVLHLLSSTLPAILVDTRDMSILHLLLPLLISALLIPTLPPLPPTLAPHLLLLLSLSPPSTILDLTLDLLISLTVTPGPARIVLASPNISAHLKHLVRLLEHGARQTSASFDPQTWTMGGLARNPASTVWAAEEASKRRAAEREEAQRRIQVYGQGSVVGEVGDRPPGLADTIKARLYKMKEPERSVAWMHESFVYSSTAQLPQVAFWHAYRDFFTHQQVADQLLSASEVIKNVTLAFPGASAKVWIDETNTQRFVIAGIGFRKSTDELEKYTCRWRSCPNPSGSTTPTQLLTHLHAHLYAPTSCNWASCTVSPCTMSHLLTHIPVPRGHPVPEMVLNNPVASTSAPSWLSSPQLTSRGVPRLPSSYKLHFTAFSTPTDQRRHPIGAAFLSSLLIRNLAKTLKSEISISSPSDLTRPEDLMLDTRAQKKRKERFGLPIPDKVLQEEEEEERDAEKEDEVDGKLNWEERDRARAAFEGVEERLGEVVAGNLSGLGQYLGEAWGW